jgi:P4 family phage/plasmid primase-like protien
MLIFEGSGSNGKSVVLEVLLALVGWGNAFRPLHELTEDRFATADLHHKLVNLCGEIEDRELRNTATLKAIVGGDAISAQRKRGHAFSFRPVARLIGTANALPATADPSDGFFRRIDIISFPVNIAREHQDRDLASKLIDELSGILNLCLTALRGLRERGDFIEAPGVDEANARYRERVDATAGFIAECVAFGHDLSVPRSLLFDRFSRWCDSTGRKASGAPKFYERFESREGPFSRLGNAEWDAALDATRGAVACGVRGQAGARQVGCGRGADRPGENDPDRRTGGMCGHCEKPIPLGRSAVRGTARTVAAGTRTSGGWPCGLVRPAVYAGKDSSCRPASSTPRRARQFAVLLKRSQPVSRCKPAIATVPRRPPPSSNLGASRAVTSTKPTLVSISRSSEGA